jgi:purine nucleoside phosphorylase
VCIEGPAFSTGAALHWYRSLGAAAIGMTNMPAARLACEAGMACARFALSAPALLGMPLVIQLFVYPGADATHGTWAAVLL